MNTAVATMPRAKSAKKPTAAPARAGWVAASDNVLKQLADAIDLLRDASKAAGKCETQAEKAVCDLGEMLGERMLPDVSAVLEQGPINSNRARTAFSLMSDPIQILEALTGVAAGSPFEASVRTANALVLGANTALTEMRPWDEAPVDPPVLAQVQRKRSHVFEGDRPSYVVFHASTRYEAACEIVKLRAEELDSRLVDALLDLMEICTPKLEALVGNRELTNREISPVYAEMDVIEGLMSHACEDSDDPVLWGGIYCLRLALEMVEEAITLAAENEASPVPA